MSGHSKWSQIKHKKEITDKKRAVMFSKILTALSVAARQNPNPDFNPRLRTLIEKAKEAKVPQENIERAISKAKETTNLEEIRIETCGPEKILIIIDAITNNRNRTIGEIKKLLGENEMKMMDQGAAMWAFENINNELKPKYTQQISDIAKEKISGLVDLLEDHHDVQKITTNINNGS